MSRLDKFKGHLTQLRTAQELEKKLARLWEGSAEQLAVLEKLQSEHGSDLAELSRLDVSLEPRAKDFPAEAVGILDRLSSGISGYRWCANELHKKDGRAGQDQIVERLQAGDGLASELSGRIQRLFSKLELGS